MDPKTKPAPSASFGQSRDFAAWGRDRFEARTLLENSHVRVLLVALESGWEIPLHAPAADLLVVVVEGVGEILAADRVLRAGEVAVVRFLGDATRTMALEHELIGARVAELEGLAAAGQYDAPIRAELRRSLIGREACCAATSTKRSRCTCRCSSTSRATSPKRWRHG